MDNEEQPVGTYQAQNQPPSVHVDYGVFSVDVYGGQYDTLEDVNATVDERIESALDDVQELKRSDYELADEFETDPNSGEKRSSHDGHYQ